MVERPDICRVFTFYSYKGGVGRSMAVANVAFILARRHGKRVICVDWDLEAPGLHFYLGLDDAALASRPGLLEYLIDFDLASRQPDPGVEPSLDRYLSEPPESLRTAAGPGSVRLLPCGRTDALYFQRLETFGWHGFFSNGERRGYEIVTVLRRRLLELADIVLIDARAGQADLAVTPTVQLPDVVVLLFTSTDQSLAGSARIARRLVGHPLARQRDEGPPHVLLVPSRVFREEESYQRWSEEAVEPLFRELVRDGVIEDDPLLRAALDDGGLPVDPKASVREQLVVADPARRATAERLSTGYERLGQTLDTMNRGLRFWSPAARGETALETTPTDERRKELDDAVRRGDEQAVAAAQFVEAQALIAEEHFGEALANLEAALTYTRRVRNAQAEGSVLHEMGRVRAGQVRLEEAWDLFQQAVALKREQSDRRSLGITLHEMGRLRAAQGRHDEAWDLFQQALDLKHLAGDRRGQGVTLHEMGRLRASRQRLDEAWDLFQQALGLLREAGDERVQAITLHEMGNLRAAQRHLDETWDLYRQALSLRESSDRRGQGVTLHEMGRLRASQRRFDEAWELLQRALALKRETGDLREQRITLLEMGRVRVWQKRCEEAWNLFGEALAPEGEPVDPGVQAVTLNEMGMLRASQQRHEEAWDLFERALAHAGGAGDRRGQRIARHAMARVHLDRGDAGSARKVAREVLAESEAEGDSEMVAAARELLQDCDRREASPT